MKCVKFVSLIDYLDGRLGGEEGRRVAAHLETGCPKCNEAHTWYARVRAIAAGDDSVDPPAWVLKRAVRLFGAEKGAAEATRSRRGRLKEFIASLVFDSLSRPVVAGVRLTESASRQLLYRADLYSIDLQIAPSEQHDAGLQGQVLREGETMFDSVKGLRIELSRGRRLLYCALTNEMGEFELGRVAEGDYELRIVVREGALIIPQLIIT